MCHVLHVSTSGYYTWSKRQPSARMQADQKLSKRIHEIHEKSKGTYGAPRIHAELADIDELYMGRKRVARPMRAEGLQGVSRRKAPHTTQKKPGARPAPDLVQRNFIASAPNRLWVADVTYIANWTGWLYLAVVVDAWSRKVIGWAMSTHLQIALVMDTLQMAIQQRRPEDVIYHSDQGSQYTSLAFGQRCREAGVRPSTGSVGDCFDNALWESFFATLECELLDRRTFYNQPEARQAVFAFIEGWYNPYRRHSAIDYLSPNSYEVLHARTPQSSSHQWSARMRTST